MRDRPRIGLIGNLEHRRTWRLDIPLRYAESVRRAGGLPLGIHPSTDERELEALVAHLDGIVLIGGDDFDTARLGLGPTHPAAQPVPALKQDADLALVRIALEADLPLLGICYGMQLMAIAGGGSLLQHLPDDRPGCQPHGGSQFGGEIEHSVRTTPGTKLARALGVGELSVASRHHQAVRSTGAGWIPAAHDGEGLIEAVESEVARFAIGVQWHPELSPEDHPDGRLFRALIDAARGRTATPTTC